MTSRGKIILGDCREVMKGFADDEFDLILTDPPYPDYHTDLYKYQPGFLDDLKRFKCRQLIFWTAKEPFPLDYTAIHIWDKKTGAGSQYERIFERNGGSDYRVFRYYLINSTVAANFTGDTFEGHPSQKPIKLMRDLVGKFSKEGDHILDPFAGSGSTLRAAKDLNRQCTAIEINPKYIEIIKKRERQEVLL